MWENKLNNGKIKDNFENEREIIVFWNIAKNEQNMDCLWMINEQNMDCLWMINEQNEKIRTCPSLYTTHLMTLF